MIVSRSPSDMPVRYNYASVHRNRPTSSSGANAALSLMVMMSPSLQPRGDTTPTTALDKPAPQSPPLTKPALTISLRAPKIETRAARPKARANTPVPFYPDRRLQRLFKRFPYATHAKIVARGFVRRQSRHVTFAGSCVPVEIAQLCCAYYVDAEEGAFQIARKLHSVLKQLRQRSITRKMLILVLTKYLRLRDESEADEFCAELLRTEYIAPVKERKLEGLILKERRVKATLYQIPMDKVLLFGTYKA